MSSSTPLDYALPPPLHHRRSVRRWLLIAILLAGIAPVAWKAPEIRRNLKLMYWQHRCMIYTPPVGQISLVAGENGVIQKTVPSEWAKFYSILSPPGFTSDGTVFLHQMTKRNGESRLVAVDMIYTTSGGGNDFNYEQARPFIRVFTPGGAFTPPGEVSHTDSVELDELVKGPQHSNTYFSGLTKSDDPSCFTFRANISGKETIYDGWLRDDDVVVITERVNRK